MDYLREAASMKPDNVLINLHRYGVRVEMSDHRGIQQKTLSWIEVETCRINPIIATIDMMRVTHQ